MTGTPELSSSARWFSGPDRCAHTDQPVLYCIPHSGGSESTYRGWAEALPGLHVLAIRKPGHGTRWSEQPYVQIDALVQDLAAAIIDATTAPRIAIFGHSLGALIAFEVARHLATTAVGLAHLFVSGCPAPQLAASTPGPAAETLDDDQIVEMLRQLGGTSEMVLASRTGRRMIIPGFRADLQVRHSYRYCGAEPLDVPITAVAATHDARASLTSMRGWECQTQRDFRLHIVAGDHFSVINHPETVLGYLASAMGPDRRDAQPSPALISTPA
jgi:medium-chain acyl-[acyl-carrier-protein] hydrolase